MSKLKTFFLGSVILLPLAFSSVEVATAATCSVSTIRGGYGAVLSGVSNGVVLDSGGVVVADGKGNLSGTWTANASGTVETKVPFKGTYSVSANCAGKPN